jgi:hypothetical protein
VLKIYNPQPEEIPLALIFSTSADDLGSGDANLLFLAPAITTIGLPPGYSSHRFDAALFRFLEIPFKSTMELRQKAMLIWYS